MIKYLLIAWMSGPNSVPGTVKAEFDDYKDCAVVAQGMNADSLRNATEKDTGITYWVCIEKK